MNKIYKLIILSKEFIEESRKTTPGCDPRDLRRSMVDALNRQAARSAVILDGDDLVLQEMFIQGCFDREDIVERVQSQFLGRLRRRRQGRAG